MLVRMTADTGDAIDVDAILGEVVLDWTLVVGVFVLLVNME